MGPSNYTVDLMRQFRTKTVTEHRELMACIMRNSLLTRILKKKGLL